MSFPANKPDAGTEKDLRKIQEDKNMAVINELIRVEADNTLSFGDYTLNEKTKLTDFEFEGDLYKVKTYNEITKLEKNGGFLYESVPGSTVRNFKVGIDAVSFTVEAEEDVQITLELEEDKVYRVFVNNTNIGQMRTNLGGKVSISVELLNSNKTASVFIERV